MEKVQLFSIAKLTYHHKMGNESPERKIEITFMLTHSFQYFIQLLIYYRVCFIQISIVLIWKQIQQKQIVVITLILFE